MKNTIYDVSYYVHNRLSELEAHPRMWAASREGFAARVDTLIEMLNPQDHQAFMVEMFAVSGTCAASGMFDRLDDEWARAAVAVARKLIAEIL